MVSGRLQTIGWPSTRGLRFEDGLQLARGGMLGPKSNQVLHPTTQGRAAFLENILRMHLQSSSG